LRAGGWQIHAANITSSTQCNCCDILSPGCSGEFSVTGFTVTDPSGTTTAITPSGSPNQPLPGGIGTVTFNERISAPGDLTVNGAHLNVTIGGTNYNIVVASSHSDITCPGTIVTAGEVNISGRVVDQNGNGILRATVSVTNSQGTVVKSVLSGQNGLYTLTGIQSGSTYIVNASHRSYVFTPRVLNLLDEVSGFNLIGSPK
jgi:hypothetical protein